MSKMGISTLQSYCGAQIFEAVGLDQRVRRQVLHADRVAHRRRRHRRHRRGSAASGTAARSRRAPVGEHGPRLGRRVPVAARRRVPPVQPGHGLQAAARDAQRAVRDLQGVHAGSSTTRASSCATLRGLLELKTGGEAGPDRRGRAGRVDRQALRDRRDVVRLDQPGSARDARDRDEPHRRQVEHRRRRRGPGALHAATRTATRGAAPSSRSRRRASA